MHPREACTASRRRCVACDDLCVTEMAGGPPPKASHRLYSASWDKTVTRLFLPETSVSCDFHFSTWQIKLWAMGTADTMQTVHAHEDGINTMIAASDGSALYTGSEVMIASFPEHASDP